MNDLQVAQPEPKAVERLTASQIRADVNLIQEVMKAVMIDKVHYGTVPGCGDKPTLLKPGAEKIASTFRLAIEPVVEDLSTADEIRYRVAAKATNQNSGQFLGSGIGEASTNEEKYKWRAAVCDQEYDETDAERKRSKWKAGWNGGAAKQIKQVRTNPADVANTVLKMAKKRALIDAVLTITAASDIFTQDIEDMPDELAKEIGSDAPQAVQTPKAKAPEPTAPAPTNGNPQAVPAKDRMRQMNAQYKSKCRACPEPIGPGDPIYYDAGSKSAYHPECVGA